MCISTFHPKDSRYSRYAVFTIRYSSPDIVTTQQLIIYARVQYRKIPSPTPSNVGRMGEVDIDYT